MDSHKSFTEVVPLKTTEVIQQAMIKAGLLTQDRADRVNIILREEKRKEERRLKRLKRQRQAERAAQMHKRWHGQF